MVSAIHDDE